VWFKADLRTADHPGLLAAVQRAAADGVTVIPFFCLDPQLYADLALTPKGPEGEAHHQQQQQQSQLMEERGVGVQAQQERALLYTAAAAAGPAAWAWAECHQQQSPTVCSSLRQRAGRGCSSQSTTHGSGAVHMSELAAAHMHTWSGA
jgi:hypothetical protein